MITFLMQKGFEPQFFKEPDEELYFAQFPETPEVEKAIKEWKDENLQVQIHKYLNCYKDLRLTIRKMREV